MIRYLFLNFPRFCIKTVVVTKQLTFDIFFSTSAIFVLQTVEVTKLLTLDILLSTSPMFSTHFVHLCFIDLCGSK